MYKKSEMRKIAEDSKIIAIMRGVPLKYAVDFAKVCADGGIKALEVALNSENALEEISLIKEKLGDKLRVGAGTAITVDLAKDARKAGAEFILTPSVFEDVVKYATETDLPMLPGIFTPTDVGICYRYGIDTFKLFPAGNMPLSYVKLLKGPFDDTEYVAVGGITREEIRMYLNAGYIGAAIGGGLFDRKLLESGNLEEATKQVKDLLNQ